MATEKQIAYFCGHCDRKNNRERCPRGDQARYVDRNWCGWSYIEGVHVFPVTSATITVGGVKYRRRDKGEIREAIERKKTKSS